MHAGEAAIRLAREEDLASIVQIYTAATGSGGFSTADGAASSLEARQPWFTQHQSGGYPLWVLTRASRVLGWLALERFYGGAVYRYTAEVAVYIATAAQGQGLGGRLLDHALAQAPALGLHTLLALIFTDNHSSLALFRSRDFRRWGHLPRVARIAGVAHSLDILGRPLA